MTEHPILFSAPMVRALLDGTKTQTRRPLYVPTKNFASATMDRRYLPDYGNGEWPNLPPGSAWTLSGWRDAKLGDRLWVRETFFAFGRWETRFSKKKVRYEWHFVDMTTECGRSHICAADGVYPAPMAEDWNKGGTTPMWWKRPAIFMPRAASRLTLEVAGVRVGRLQDISEVDAKAEGCERLDDDEPGYIHREEPDWKLCPRCGGTRLYTAFNPATGGALPGSDCTECDTYVKRYRHLWESINGRESWAANPWVWVVEFRRITP